MKRIAMALVALLVMVTLVSSATMAESPTNATVSHDGHSTMLSSEDGLFWKVGFAYGGATLQVSGPDGWLDEATFGANAPLRWEIDASTLADGRYQYALRFAPLFSAAAQAALDAAPERPERELVVAQLVASGEMPETMPVIADSFVVSDGAILLPSAEPKGDRDGTSAGAMAGDGRSLNAIEHDDDVYIVGGLCVGVGCDGSESYSFITVHLKEDNPRFRFTDNSVLEGYPTRDWELVANDSAQYGADYFAVRDIDAGTKPLLIEGTAPSNALRIDDDGRVGIGTGDPQMRLHLYYENAPTIRLQQGGGLFSPYTWDLFGHESWFALRDAVAGTDPIRVYPGEANYVLVLRGGNMGVGLESPQYDLHLYDQMDYPELVIDHGAQVRAMVAVTETQTLVGSLTDHPVMLMAGYDSDSGETGAAVTLDVSGTLTVTAGLNPTMQLDPNGNMVLSGALTEASDVNRKEHFQAVDGEAVLTALVDLPISTWNYIGDDPATRHMGPMAQDFYAAFGLGADETHLAPLDVNGVTLVALQAQNRQIAALEAENAELGTRLDQLEALVAELLSEE